MPDETLLLDVQDVAAVTERPQPAPEAEPEKDNKNPEFLAVKFAFTPSRGDMGGAFCVIFEGKTGKTVFQVFWVGKPYAKGVMLEPGKNWRTFVKKFPQCGPLDKDWGEKLQAQLKEILTAQEKRTLYGNYTKVKIRQLESMIRRAFEGASQCVFSAATDVEPVSRNELERAKVIKPLPPSPEELARQKAEQEERERAEQEEKEKQEAKKEGNFEGTIIMCTPQVDPVRGKASSEIVPGDIIGVNIEGEGTSALVKKFLDENNLEPLFPVDEIRETSGKKFLYVKISDEIRGAVSITKDIKIRTKEPPQPEKKNHGSFLGDVFFFGLLGVAAIALLFVIRYFFIE